MEKRTIEVPVRVDEKRRDGGRIVITTPSEDRYADVVMPLGGKVENYMRNPVVQWGHNYFDPWATIGRTVSLTTGADGMSVDFELREPATENDPQHIVRLLWEGGFVKAASIGFMPLKWSERGNARGGVQFDEWELLEWSLVPIPANQDALRLAVKGLDLLPPFNGEQLRTAPGRTIGVIRTLDDLREALALEPVLKRGRVLSAKNETMLREAADRINGVLASVDAQSGEDEAAGDKGQEGKEGGQHRPEEAGEDSAISEEEMLHLMLGMRDIYQMLTEEKR